MHAGAHTNDASGWARAQMARANTGTRPDTAPAGPRADSAPIAPSAAAAAAAAAGEGFQTEAQRRAWSAEGLMGPQVPARPGSGARSTPVIHAQLRFHSSRNSGDNVEDARRPLGGLAGQPARRRGTLMRLGVGRGLGGGRGCKGPSRRGHWQCIRAASLNGPHGSSRGPLTENSASSRLEAASHAIPRGTCVGWQGGRASGVRIRTARDAREEAQVRCWRRL